MISVMKNIQGTSSHHFHPPLHPQGIGHRSRHHGLRRVDLRCRTKDEAEVHAEQGAVLSLPCENIGKLGKDTGKMMKNDEQCRFKMI